MTLKGFTKIFLANQKEKENSIKEMKEHCREIENVSKTYRPRIIGEREKR